MKLRVVAGGCSALAIVLVPGILGCRKPVVDTAPRLPSSGSPMTSGLVKAPDFLPRPTGDAATYIKSLQKQPAGKGLFIFPPVVTQASLSPNVTTACARWLYLMLANSEDFPQTPSWYMGAALQLYLGRKDIRMSPNEAAYAAELAGTTHYAAGTAEPGKLTYRLYERGGKPVGAPIVTSGTDAQLIAALPQIAGAMRERLGLPKKAFPTPTETPEDMALLGSVPILIGHDINRHTAEALHKVAPKSLLGSLLYMSAYARTERYPEHLLARAERLIKMAGDNPLVLASVCSTEGLIYRGVTGVTAISVAAKKLPGNRSVALARTTIANSREQQIEFTEAYVRAAPTNSDAWVRLAKTLGASSQDLRKSRTADQISPQEWAKLNAIYERNFAAAVEGLRLNPKDMTAAHELATVGMFAGEEEVARKALEIGWKCVETQRGQPMIVQWAFQMNHPKWGGSEEMMNETAKRAVALPIVDLLQSCTIMNNLVGRYDDEAKQMAKRIIDGAAQRQKVEPDFLVSYTARRMALTVLGRHEEALKEALKGAALCPADVEQDMAIIIGYQTLKRYPEARAAALKLAKVCPNVYDVQQLTASIFVEQKMPKEALPFALKAAALIPGNSYAQSMAGYALAEGANRRQEALAYYQRAYDINPYDPEMQAGLGMILCEIKRVKEGRTYLEKALERARDPELIKNVKEYLQKYPAPKK